MTDRYLLLWLEAPLQSWGHDSRFGRRDSLDFPTKSGVLGLLCCARGASGEQTEWLHHWAERDLQVRAYVRQDRQGLPLQRLPLLRDFNMVGSGYDDQDPWASMLIPKTSTGKKAVGGGAKMTYRYYIQDMAYAVALQGSQDELETLANALANPVWDLYLGRKTCVPTEFIVQGVHSDEKTAFAVADELAVSKGRILSFRVLQGEHKGEVLTLNDVPLQFGERKKYRDRRVTIQGTE
ncbi:MAG: type I-E CRISPR-associated protein Cas5/CasD [Halioglobus sp.]|nr:type I-E CRISPR-associated protein Cas5/CasD [Halioglobus sp.]